MYLPQQVPFTPSAPFDALFGVEVFEALPDSARIVAAATPAGRVATVVNMGPYDGLPEAHEAIRAWCVELGHDLAGQN